MMNRRDFIKQSSAALMATQLSDFQLVTDELKRVKKLGIQLFSLPKSLDKDFVGTVKMLAGMGYKELELFGPYPFSDEAAIKGWANTGKMLGFAGSGYFGRTMQEVKQILDDNGLKTPSAHSDFDTLMTKMDKFGEAAAILGHKYVVLPAIPDQHRQTLDDYKRTAEKFNKIGEAAKKVGLKFGYHNHGYGLKPVDGKMPIETLFENTDPNLVFLELDVFWTAAGGVDPIAMLEKYPKRYRLLHLKDMKEKKTFKGDGGTIGDWMPMFPLMTTAGDGVLNVAGIVQKAQEIGVKHYFVEQDLVANPEVALKRSADFLRK
jgi:sugar phosphate isomerase/epimerase